MSDISSEYDKIDSLFIAKDLDRINSVFMFLCYGYDTNNDIELIKYMVESGIDPRMDNDEPFVTSCLAQDVRIPLYFLNECGADIHAQNNEGFKRAVKRNSLMLKIFFEANAAIPDDVITAAIESGNDIVIERFIGHGVEPEHICQLLFQQIHVDNGGLYSRTLKTLIKYDTDFTRGIRRVFK